MKYLKMNDRMSKAYKFSIFVILRDFFVLSYIGGAYRVANQQTTAARRALEWI